MVKMVQGVSFNMACQICQKSFSSTAARDQHVRAKHGNKGSPVIQDDPYVNERGYSERISPLQDRYINAVRGKDRIRVEMAFDADTDRLFGNLDGAISYLEDIRSRYPDAELDENRTGHETSRIVFVYSRLETDEEYRSRQDDEDRMRERAEEQRAREKAHAEKVKEYQRLGRELGYRH